MFSRNIYIYIILSYFIFEEPFDSNKCKKRSNRKKITPSHSSARLRCPRALSLLVLRRLFRFTYWQNIQVCQLALQLSIPFRRVRIELHLALKAIRNTGRRPRCWTVYDFYRGSWHGCAILTLWLYFATATVTTTTVATTTCVCHRLIVAGGVGWVGVAQVGVGSTLIVSVQFFGLVKRKLLGWNG